MRKEKALEELKRIVREYIDEPKIVRKLCKQADNYSVKYVLSELEKYRKKSFSNDDSGTIKDLFFYFC